MIASANSALITAYSMLVTPRLQSKKRRRRCILRLCEIGVNILNHDDQDPIYTHLTFIHFSFNLTYCVIEVRTRKQRVKSCSPVQYPCEMQSCGALLGSLQGGLNQL